MEINPQAPFVVQKEIFIQASPAVVWQIQTNINSWKDWQTAISHAQLDGELKPKARFKWTSGGFAITSMIQEIVPQRRIAWSGQAFGSSVKHVWLFQPQQDGTLVTTAESMEGWLVWLLKPFMPGFLDKSLDVWLQNLKRKAEGKTGINHVAK